ncbi:transcriptional regulator, LacI family [Gracilibacillus ureilyticus]|uniref:Transcriptional regulator, LacI family n=1 Tax=Gracilibacillus ureilyticus TaxID=531814 RepID=A0A1H9QPK9_9BACI|nr:LacI family DNA-binding transcriptional regulator [Gracilibacillus ureilyticus]SER62521.1 transcriptional regulator, LacI family [Gracilibacillus ureilyticus]
MTNIKDIARIAGVSVSTVSRVINNHPYVSEEKKSAVLEAMEKTNYQINMKAVHLSKGKSQLIGVVVPFANHPYFGLLVEGIANKAVSYHFHFVLIQTNYEEEREREALDMLKHKQIDGLIICSRISEMKQIREYTNYGRIVLCENAANYDFVSSVYIDHFQAFYDALTFLYQKEYRKIGYCIGRESGSNSYNRKKAYKQFHEEMELVCNKQYIFSENYYLEDGEKVVREIRQMGNPPEALLVTSDAVAAGILMACEKNGIKVPGDMAIIGFGNQPISKSMEITTFEIPLVKMGERLFEQVIGKNQIKHEELKIQLIERNTV